MSFATVTQHRTGGWMFLCSCGTEGEHRSGDRSQAYRDRAQHEREEHPKPTPTEQTMNEPARYRKLPVTIEAAQWDGTVEGTTKIIDWVLANGGTARYHDSETEGGPAFIAVDTPDAVGRVFAQHWMMHGTRGEFYPCDDVSFADSYAPEP